MKLAINHWGDAVGLGREFNGRWDDGWISKRYSNFLDVDENASHLEITGRHMAPFGIGLKLTIRLDGRIVASKQLVDHGPFQIAFELSTEPQSKHGLLKI